MANINNFYRGDKKAWKFDFGKGVDITDWKIYLTLKEDTDGDVILQVSSVAGDNLLDDIPNGIMYVTAEVVDTGILVPGTKYFYGFQRSIVDAVPIDIKTLMTGTVKILQDITLLES